MRRNVHAGLSAGPLLGLALLLSPARPTAQTTVHPASQATTPAIAGQAQPPVSKPTVPEEIHDEGTDQPVAKSSWFTIHIGGAPIFDYTWFSQDDASISQVGVQEDQHDIRSARIMARGTLFSNHTRPWKYMVSFEYRGFDTNPDNNWSWTDLYVTIPAGPLGELTVGKIKEPYTYEMVGDAANLPHLERLLSPFFTSRSVGARLNKTVLNERSTLAFGAFNDWFLRDLSYGDSGWDVAARATALPLWSNAGRRFLHVGTAWRFVGADDGLLRYRGRPESNVADYYVDAKLDVDTKGIPAAHANHWAAEALWNEGPVSLLAEYDEARVSSVEARDPVFSGWYATASWVVTGEHRPYDRKAGYARRVLPKRKWGAIELIARYGVVDTVDKNIDGGYLRKWFTAVNYLPTNHWRFSLGYGQATLDKGGVTGRTDQLLARVQAVY